MTPWFDAALTAGCVLMLIVDCVLVVSAWRPPLGRPRTACGRAGQAARSGHDECGHSIREAEAVRDVR